MSGVSLHPSPTASDGSPFEQSHYIKNSEKIEQYIECAQCGFLVNLQTRTSGPSLGAIGDPTIVAGSGTPPSPGIAFTDSYGDPVDTKSGCPFCNSMNSKGIGRNNDPFAFNNTDIENF